LESLDWDMGQIIGPHFFERIINDSIYLDFLQNHLPIYFQDIPLDGRQRLWFQQNDALAYYSQDVWIF